MYLIAACLPLLRPIFTKHLPTRLRDVLASFGNSSKSESCHRELSSGSGARLGFNQPNMSDGTVNNNAAKSEFSKGSTECSYEGDICSESKDLPLQGIEVTKEVMIRHSEIKEGAKV
jgi:hypothetical protein